MKIEGVALTPEETDGFLKAAQNVARHYSVETTQRTLDWAAFVAISAQVFGTRALTVVIHNSRTKRAAPNGGATVVEFPNGNLNGGYHPSVPTGGDDYDV